MEGCDKLSEGKLSQVNVNERKWFVCVRQTYNISAISRVNASELTCKFNTPVLTLRSLAITLVIARMSYMFDVRSLAFTCDNLSQPSVTYRNS